MWSLVTSGDHIEKYSRDEHWLPMTRALRHLQSLPLAAGLRGFTSLYRFHLTTAPGYEECDGHASITILWFPHEQRFHLAFGELDDGWVDDRPPERVCSEEEFPAAIEPFIQRLLASRSGPPAPSP